MTPNDPGDGDTGANNLQNFPVLTVVSSSSGSTTIAGTLNSTASTSFDLQFFANPSCDLFGNGEGAMFIGSATVMTNGSGNASFTVTLPTPLPFGHVMTATATDPSGNTSEFSECVTVLPRLQDDRSANCLTLNEGAGTYTFKTSSGTFTGPVVITQTGTILNFQSGPGDPNLLQGGVDLLRRVGNARLNVPRGGPAVFTVSDRNIDNNGPCP